MFIKKCKENAKNVINSFNLFRPSLGNFQFFFYFEAFSNIVSPPLPSPCSLSDRCEERLSIWCYLQVHEADACLVLANKYCPDPDAEVTFSHFLFFKIIYFIIIPSHLPSHCMYSYCLIVSGCCKYHEGHLHQELLGQHQGHHPAHAVPQQGQSVWLLTVFCNLSVHFIIIKYPHG